VSKFCFRYLVCVLGAAFSALAFVFCGQAWGEKGIIWLRVKDLRDEDVSDVAFATSGPGTQRAPAIQGQVRLLVGSDTEPGDPVPIQLVEPTWSFLVSPWNSIIIAPSFLDKPGNFVEVRVAPKGVLDTLRDPRVEATFALRAARAKAPRWVDQAVRQPSDEIKNEATQSGLPAGEIERSLKAWAATRKTPQERAIAAILDGNYISAIRELETARPNTVHLRSFL
jgi:hypothetical protein